MILEPPAQYLPYDGPLEIRRMLPQEVGHFCRERGLKGWPLACKFWEDGICVIVVPWLNNPDAERKYINHEKAHCNGWTHP